MRTSMVETKFGVNDTAFVLWCNKIWEVRVIGINVKLETSARNVMDGYPHKPNVIIISYKVMFESKTKQEFAPDLLFETKEELLDSL